MINTKRKNCEYKEALKLRGQGMSNKAISQMLDVSEKTVSHWIRNSPTEKARKAQSSLLKRLEREAATMTPDEVAKISDSVVKLQKLAFPE